MPPVLDSSSLLPMPGRALRPAARSAAGQWLVAGIASLALHAVALVGLEWTAPWWLGADRPPPPSPRLSISLVDPPASGARSAPVATSRPAQRAAPQPARTEAVASEELRPAREIDRVDVAAGPPAVLAAAIPSAAFQSDLPISGDVSSHATSHAGAPSNAAGAGEAGSDSAGDAHADYFDALLARVMSTLDYPRRARLEQIEGVVVLSVRIDRDGAIERCEVSESSGSPLLDRHAIHVARRAAPFGPVPAAFGPDDLVFLLPVEFSQID